MYCEMIIIVSLVNKYQIATEKKKENKFLVMNSLRSDFLNNFEIYRKAILTAITMLHVRSSELLHLITESVCFD